MRSIKLVMLATLVAGGLLFVAPMAAEASGPAFVGYCTPNPSAPEDGSCTLDEPEGKNPDTYGTVTYDRTIAPPADSISFDIPGGFTPTEVQVCLTLVDDSATNPYIPTSANSCAGNSPDRALATNSPTDPTVIDVAAFFASNSNYSAGDAFWFAFHINGEGRTMYVTGGSAQEGDEPEPVTRSLEVSKEVVGDPGTSEFAFVVDCGAYELSADNTSDGGVTYTNGDANFSLGDGDSVTFSKIPETTLCTVSETVPNTPDGTWSTKIDGAADADRSSSVTLDQDRSMEFENTFTEVEGEVVTPVDPTPQDPTPQGAAPEDDVLPLELARTGLPVGLLSLIGANLVGLGSVLSMAGTRRRNRSAIVDIDVEPAPAPTSNAFRLATFGAIVAAGATARVLRRRSLG